MKVCVLMENTAACPDLQAEHGLSVYMETSGHKILADTGQSSHTWDNAVKMGVDLNAIDTVIISHGHYDHAGGLLSFAKMNPNAEIYMQKSAAGAFYHGERYIGIDRNILDLPRLHLIDGDKKIDEELSLFSGISGHRNSPSGNRLLTEKINGADVQDSFRHEQYLVVTENEKKILLSGCAHNGILNILDRYRELYNSDPYAVISGFHMMKNTAYTQKEVRDIEQTAKELSRLPTIFYTGHCTGQPAIEIMSRYMPDNLKPVHTGDILEL